MRPPHSPLSRAGLALVALATLALPLSAQPPLTPPASQPTAPPATLPEVIVEGEDAASSDSPAPPIDAPFINQPYADAPAVYDPNALFSPAASVGYAAPDSVTGTKLAISPLDFPGSVQTITESLIHDQAARNIYDLTRNVSSVGPSIGGSANRTDDLLIRGFRVQGNSDDFRKNGFRDSSRTQRDLANIDRIEILKGPAAALYGSSGEPAGLVNFITKQPLDYRQDVVSARIGYWDDYRLTLDSTGPLTNEDVTYRLNVAAQDSGSFRDFVFNERYFVAPVVRLRLAEDTYLTFEGEYLRDRRVPDRGIVLFQGSFDAIPIDRFFGEPTDQANFQDGQVSAILNHAFTDDLLLRTGYVSNWSDEYRDQVDTRRLGGGGGGGGG
ncbi:MAG: TonB-dependent receptor plug domain-containing protein, partial [Planctomycetales bacterium]|nr:TonB-dependent receptor plug domain-containing protein [Planctomycetales bacterium]